MVIVWKLDRLSRRLRDGVNLLADWCERGLKIVVITQQIELNGAVGRMIAALLLGLGGDRTGVSCRAAGGRHRGRQAEGHLQGQEAGDDEGRARPGKGTAGEGAEGRRDRPGDGDKQADGAEVLGCIGSKP